MHGIGYAFKISNDKVFIRLGNFPVASISDRLVIFSQLKRARNAKRLGGALMAGISGLSTSMLIAHDALQVHGVGIQVAAHNIANVSTAGFVPQRATFVDGANCQGVALESVQKIHAQPDINGRKPALASMDNVAPSGTELAIEFPHMINMQHGFEANTSVVRVIDEMHQSLLDIKA